MPNRLPVAERMSWAAYRETTREEDLAYCLFGIFGVNLPLLYGEGPRAFMRLQEEIVKNSTDLSIFAWVAEGSTNDFRGIFARSVREFAHAKAIVLKPSANAEFAVTNRGLRIQKRLLRPENHGVPQHDGADLMSLNCRFTHMASTTYLSIWLKKIGSFHFRVKPDQLQILDERTQSAQDKTQLLYITRNVDEDEEEERGSGSSHSQATSQYSSQYWAQIALGRHPESRKSTEG
jgi:hypothetical protein